MPTVCRSCMVKSCLGVSFNTRDCDREMELLCSEQEESASRKLNSYPDPSLLRDERVLEQLLKLEERYQPSRSYFTCLQDDIQPYMRNMVATWMAELCEEQRCEEEVFPLALNYLDRILSVKNLPKGQLQLLATGCLFIASKLRESSTLSAEKLVLYTDNSITLQQLLDQEVLIVSWLRWDLAAVTPLDYLDLLLQRLPSLHSDIARVLRYHAQTFVALAAPDFALTAFAPSVVAAAALLMAVGGKLGPAWSAAHQHTLILAVNSDPEWVGQCRETMEQIIASHSSQGGGVRVQEPRDGCGGKVTPLAPACTPTDIQDIHF